MKRRSVLRTLAGCVVAPLFGYSLPAAAKAVEDSYGFIKIQFDCVGEMIFHDGLTFMLLSKDLVCINLGKGIFNSVPLSKKEWDNGEFYNSVNKSYPHSDNRFFEIKYGDLSNIWARIVPTIYVSAEALEDIRNWTYGDEVNHVS